jgi:hypothetical protein
MAGNPKVECPECSTWIERKNLNRHYRKMHPDMDARRRMREIRHDRPQRSIQEMPRSTVAGIFIALFVMLILVSGVLLVLSFYQEGESTPDGPKPVWYTASDGAIINGTFYPAFNEGKPTIYLVHDIGSKRTVWDEYALELQKEDYNVLAIDLRGHGGSTLNIKSSDITYDWSEMTDEDMMGIQLDIQGAYSWVQGENDYGERHTDAGEDGALIGVGRGGLFALSQIAKMSRERMMSAVVVSPLLDVYSLDVEQVFEDYGDVRPVMLAASEDDSLAELAIERIMDRKIEDGEENGITYYADGGDIGMDLFDDGGLREKILEVLDQGWNT